MSTEALPGLTQPDPERRALRLREMIEEAATSKRHLNAYTSLQEIGSIDLNPGPGPLAGLALAVKDNIDALGFLTTCGSSFFKRQPDRDPPLVERFRSAGAQIVGKTNLGEFALDATSNNPHFGTVRNPVDETRTPGGSSGGSAAALAANLADVALGTDSGGSVRIPAALCGIAGYRPTGTTWPLDGIIGPAWSVDSYGIMARTTSDIRFVVHRLGLSPADGPPSTLSRTSPKIGYLADDSMGRCDPKVWARYMQAIERFQLAGFVCTPISLNGLQDAPYACAVIAYCEVASAHRATLEQEPKAYGDAIRPLLYLGDSFTTRDYLLAQQSRHTFADRFISQTELVDFVLTPTVPMTAPKINADPVIPGDEGSLALFAYIRYTCLANLIDVPTVSIRGGLADDGLPIGIQITGRWHRDSELLNLAEQLEASLLGDFEVI